MPGGAEEKEWRKYLIEEKRKRVELWYFKGKSADGKENKPQQWAKIKN